MRKGRSLFTAGLVICMTAAISLLASADEVQDSFLEDMASGLKARWAITDTLSSEELPAKEEMETRYSYLDAELEYIEKYKEEEFSNTKLDFLAKTYIYGVELQKNAVQYYQDYPVIFDTQWSAGYTTRAAALCDIYDYYGLDIDQTNVDEMRTAASPEYTYEVVTTDVTEETESTENTDDKIAITSVEASDPGYGFIELSYKVKNLTDATLKDLTLTVTELDENNDITATTYLSSSSSLEPGQSVTLTGTTLSDKKPASLKVEKYTYSDAAVSYKDATFEGSTEFLACKLDDILNDKYSKEVQSSSDNDIEVFSNEGITVTVGKMERLDYGAYRIHMHVENLNHHGIIVSADDYKTVINGNMVTSSPYADVQSGKTSSFNWDIYDDELADAGIDKIENISLKIMVSDAESYMPMYTGDEVFLNVGEDYSISTRIVYTDTEHIRQVQELLNKLGYECGSADGIPGKLTNSCILEFEKDHGLVEATEITPELIAALEEAAK